MTAIAPRVAGAITGSLLGWAVSAGAAEIGPEADLCAAINALSPGEELALRPGDYRGPCSIRRGGRPGQPIVIRAADGARPPRVVYGGGTSNVFNVHGDHVVIRGLEIGPTRADVDGVRIYAGADVTVEDCVFTQVGGIAVVANHSSVHDVVVRRNVVQASRATAMYFGCHDGVGCVVSGLVVEGNHIRGVEARPEEVGYGVQVKLNSSGAIRDNVIADTKGPGIMVYGAHDPGAASVVERNVVIGSRTSVGIVVGGGPAVVRNNVVMGSAEGGIALQDYGGRGLLRGVVVAHNTLWDNRVAGIRFLGNGVADVLVAGNAIHVRDGAPALPATRSGLRLTGNVDCSRVRCFADPERGDFSPAPGSPLIRTKRPARPARGAPDEGFRESPRSHRQAGAIERARALIRVELRSGAADAQ